MTEIHIPPEVIEAAATAIRQCRYSGRSNVDCAYAAITAALAEWVKCGMAVEGKGMDELHQFYPAIIIRTEAST